MYMWILVHISPFRVDINVPGHFFEAIFPNENFPETQTPEAIFSNVKFFLNRLFPE